MTQVAEKKHDFTQIPNFLLDIDLSLEEAHLVGFLRLWRQYATRERPAFTGSLRKLGNLLHMPKTSVQRMVKAWEAAGLVKKDSQPKEDEDREEMVLTLQVKEIWEFNDACYPSKKLCPTVGQSQPVNVPSNNGSVPSWNDGVPPWNDGVPRVSVNEGVNTIVNTKVNTLGKRESVANSEPTTPPAGASRTHSPSSSQKESSSQKQQNHSPIASPATATKPTPAHEPVAIREPNKTQKPVASQHSKEAIALMNAWDAIHGIRGHNRWEWDAIEDIVKQNGTIEQMMQVYDKIKGKRKEITPETIWLKWNELPQPEPEAPPLQGDGEVEALPLTPQQQWLRDRRKRKQEEERAGSSQLSPFAQKLQEIADQQDIEWLASLPEEEVEAVLLTPRLKELNEHAKRIRAERAAQADAQIAC